MNYVIIGMWSRSETFTSFSTAPQTIHMLQKLTYFVNMISPAPSRSTFIGSHVEFMSSTCSGVSEGTGLSEFAVLDVPFVIGAWISMSSIFSCDILD